MNYELIETDAFVEKSVRHLADAINESIAKRGACIVGLSGGKTPAAIYKALGEDTSIDWQNVHVFICDERYVPADQDGSNQKMIRSTLLASAQIPETNLHFPDTTLPIDACVAAYDKSVSELLKDGADVITLGIGGDGHTASLFPPLPPEAFGPAHAIHTQTRVFAVHDRISVTLPILTNARTRILMLQGRDKIETWHEMMVDNADERFWPLKALMKTGHLTVIMGK